FYKPEQLPKRNPKEDGQINFWFQDKAFGDVQLPLYVILEPMANGKLKVVGRYDEGLINDVAAFARFLKRPEGETATAEAGRRGQSAGAKRSAVAARPYFAPRIFC